MENALNSTTENGISEILTEMSDRLGSGRFPHALLFETADAHAADIICRYTAAAALCTAGGRRPCGQCINCRKAQSGIHPDIITIEGTGARSLHVDDIRSIRQDAYIAPNEGQRKVYIIKNAGDMSQQSQNALLKVLEEPPEYVVFILTCGSRAELLDTVLSRVQIFTVNTNAVEEGSEDDAEISDGIIEALINRDEYSLLVTCSLMRTRRQAEGTTRRLYAVFSSALMMKYGGTGEKVCADIAAAFGVNKIRRICGVLEKARELIQTNINSTLFSVYLPASLAEAAMQ